MEGVPKAKKAPKARKPVPLEGDAPLAPSAEVRRCSATATALARLDLPARRPRPRGARHARRAAAGCLIARGARRGASCATLAPLRRAARPLGARRLRRRRGRFGGATLRARASGRAAPRRRGVRPARATAPPPPARAL
jgi:hypothetical protein